MLQKICKRCGCMIEYPRTYCEECQKVVDDFRAKQRAMYKKENDRAYNKKRDPKYLRFYNSTDWKILSAKYMADHGYRCQGCGKIASEVHHIIPIQKEDGWNRRLDYDNLEAVCVDCHNARHGRFIKRKQGRR